MLRHSPAQPEAQRRRVEVAAAPSAARAGAVPVGGRRLRVIGGPMVVEERSGVIEFPPGNPQRLVGVVVANAGLASFDQISEAIWPGTTSRPAAPGCATCCSGCGESRGDLVVRSGSGVRLAADVGCDLHEFERLADDAMAAARTDPDLAGHLAEQAIALADGPVFGDFEYEEWAIVARRSVEHRLIGLLDLLSVRPRTPATCRWPSRSPNGRSVSTATPTRGTSGSPNCSRCRAAQPRPSRCSRMQRGWLGDRRCVPGTVKRRRDDLMRRASNS